MKRSHDAVLKEACSTTTRATVARILSTFDRATPADIAAGVDWYGDASLVVAQLSAASGHTEEMCAAVVAHLSPRTTWSRNVLGATSLILRDIAPGCLSRNVASARKAMASNDPLGTLNGPKVKAFAANILGDREAVTVDVWAMRVAIPAMADTRALDRAGVYDAVAHAYRLAAARRGVDPATMQAVCWVVARNGRSA